MVSKYENTRKALHEMPRSVALALIADSDLTARERDILIEHELERATTIKALADKYHIDERCILRSKQHALSKIRLS